MVLKIDLAHRTSAWAPNFDVTTEGEYLSLEG